MNLLALDTRWRHFHDDTWSCPCCGRSFSGVFDIGYEHPDCWPHGGLVDEGQSELHVGEDKLSADLCRWEEHRFIRCVLPLPIQGIDEVFNFGPWASVAPKTFYHYIDHATGNSSDFDCGSAWLMNDLPLFESDEPTTCELRAGAEGQRPQLVVGEGKLSKAQESGITFDQLLDIYAATGNDIRPHLRG